MNKFTAVVEVRDGGGGMKSVSLCGDGFNVTAKLVEEYVGAAVAEVMGEALRGEVSRDSVTQILVRVSRWPG